MEYAQEGILIVNLMEYLFSKARHTATIAPSVFHIWIMLSKGQSYLTMYSNATRIQLLINFNLYRMRYIPAVDGMRGLC